MHLVDTIRVGWMTQSFLGATSRQGWVQMCICIHKFGVFVTELKVAKGHVFVFKIVSVFEKYLQIQSNTYHI